MADSNRVKVRTTMNPGEEIEVSRQEALDLERQGLLAETPPIVPVKRPVKETETNG
jgi:hypothetical protein